MITYKTEANLSIDSILQLYSNSGYFPIEDMTDVARIRRMHENANLVMAAWAGDKLVGLARSVTDFTYCCYLSDLCVDKNYLNQGIGKNLVLLTHSKAGKTCKLILQANEASMGFYERIGMTRIDSAFIIQRTH